MRISSKRGSCDDRAHERLDTHVAANELITSVLRGNQRILW